MSKYKILAINPGSTSTKIAVYNDNQEVFETTLRHEATELEKFENVIDQYDFRKQVIMDSLKEAGVNINELNAVVGRGGLLKPIEGGTYTVNEAMINDLKNPPMGEHASNLGGALAGEIGSNLNIPAFIVDPVVVDEMEDIARISGMPENPRVSIFHALNQKAVAKRASKEMNKKYEDINLIVAHMGGGVSVGAHRKGRVIDVNNGLNGEGPFSPERSGGVPVGGLIEMCFSGKYSNADMKKKNKGQGGLMAYLGTSDGREVSSMVEKGDKKAELVYKALAYQVAKEIGAAAVALKGKVDAIILTGGLAYDKELCSWIKEDVSFISDVISYPGEDEMLALTEGAIRILNGEEKAKIYK